VLEEAPEFVGQHAEAHPAELAVVVAGPVVAKRRAEGRLTVGQGAGPDRLTDC